MNYFTQHVTKVFSSCVTEFVVTEVQLFDHIIILFHNKENVELKRMLI